MSKHTERNEMKALAEILNERGCRYGEFKDHAKVTQELKKIIQRYDEKLSDSQMEALEMIMHKIGRILNGDPDYDDSWIDISGYATLIANELTQDIK